MKSFSSQFSQATLDAFDYFERIDFLNIPAAVKGTSAIRQLDWFWSQTEPNSSLTSPMHELLMTLWGLNRNANSELPSSELPSFDNPDFLPYLSALEKVQKLISMHEELGLSSGHLTIQHTTDPVVGVKFNGNEYSIYDIESDDQYAIRASLLRSASTGKTIKRECEFVNKKGPKSQDTFTIRKLWSKLQISEEQLVDKQLFKSPFSMIAELLHAVGYDMDVKLVEQTIKRTFKAS